MITVDELRCLSVIGKKLFDWQAKLDSNGSITPLFATKLAMDAQTTLKINKSYRINFFFHTFKSDSIIIVKIALQNQ